MNIFVYQYFINILWLQVTHRLVLLHAPSWLLFFLMFGWSYCYRSRKLIEIYQQLDFQKGMAILWPSMRPASFPHEWVILENQLGVFRYIQIISQKNLTYIIIELELTPLSSHVLCSKNSWDQTVPLCFFQPPRKGHHYVGTPPKRLGLGKELPKTWLLHWGAKRWDMDDASLLGG